MEHALEIPGLEQRRLVVRQKGMLSPVELLDNGIAAQELARGRRHRDFALKQEDGREVAATVHCSIFGQISAVTIEGQRIAVPHINNITYVALMLPLFILEIFGGLLGVMIGILGLLLNCLICIGDRPPSSKVAICIGICAAAWILYAISAMLFVHAMLTSF